MSRNRKHTQRDIRQISPSFAAPAAKWRPQQPGTNITHSACRFFVPVDFWPYVGAALAAVFCRRTAARYPTIAACSARKRSRLAKCGGVRYFGNKKTARRRLFKRSRDATGKPLGMALTGLQRDRLTGVRGLLVCCADYKCRLNSAPNAGRMRCVDQAALSDMLRLRRR